MSGMRAYFRQMQGRSTAEAKQCGDFCKEWWKEETRHIVRIAEEAVRHEFLFDLSWDMEQTCEIVRFGESIDWQFMPGEDPEFIFQMNRNRYWICMGQAYLMSGDEKYADEFAAQLMSWIQSNPITEETKRTTWRTIEAGIRGEYWIKAMGYFIDSPAVTDEVWTNFQEALILHGDYLLACEVPFSVKSNWGVLENHGLFMIGLALGEHLKAKTYLETAVSRLCEQARVQIPEDGVHWEQSPMYHNEVLKCYLEVIRSAECYGVNLPKILYEKTKRLSYANLIWARPNHLQPAGGDSDDTDVRDLLTICSLQFMDGILKSGAYVRMDFEGIWDYGIGSQKRYEAIEVRVPAETMFEMKNSGNWYLRSGWGEQGDYLHFRCGSLGGGHGHFDKLHVDLSIRGEDVLVDSGRYTYVDSEERYRLKGAAAHNVPIVDDREYTNCLNSWGVSNMTLPVNQRAEQIGNYTYFCGGHLGYLSQGIFVNRRIVALGTKRYVILDEFLGTGNHTYSQRYHFHPEGTVAVTDNQAVYHGKQEEVIFAFFSSGQTDCNVKTEECLLSGHYNQKRTGTVMKASCQAEAPVSLLTVIAGSNGADPISLHVHREVVTAPVSGAVLSDRQAEAIRIEVGKERYLLVFSHLETGADCEYIGAMGLYAMGQVMVSDLNEEHPSLTVLHW